MKIRELQEKLAKLDPELEVVCYAEDQELVVRDRGFMLLDITDVGTTSARQIRLDDDDETPYLEFGEDGAAQIIATLEVTMHF